MLTGWNFSDALAEAIRTKKCPLIAGLDPQFRFMPPQMVEWAVLTFGENWGAMAELYYAFNCKVIDALADIVPAVKPQRAFYEAIGPEGDWAFCKTVEYAHKAGLLVIEDAKRGDGGDTADAYADGHLGEVPFFGGKTKKSPTRVDCMTVHGYIGQACIEPFVKRVKQFGTGIFVVTKTSFNPNSDVEQLIAASGRRVWEEVAEMVHVWGAGTEGACGLRNVGVVTGATYPEDAVAMRGILPNTWFLIPGYGAQGGGAKGAVVGVRPDGLGGVINSSRGVIYAYLDKGGKPRYDPEREPGKWIDFVRQAGIAGRDELVEACLADNKWPFGKSTIAA